MRRIGGLVFACLLAACGGGDGGGGGGASGPGGSGGSGGAGGSGGSSSACSTDADCPVGAPFCVEGACGAEAPEPPSLRCDPAALTFGNVVQTWDEIVLPVDCTNEGDAALVVTRELDGPFGLFDQDPLVPVTLQPGESVQSRVTIETATPGAATGELRLVGQGGAVLARIALAGTVAPEPFAIEPAALDFGMVAPGSELRKTVRLRNFTREPLHVQHPGFSNVFQIGSGANFAVPPDDPGTAQDEGFLEIDVVFAPEFEGPVLETFSFQPATGSSEQLRLEGRGGAPVLLCDAEELDLGATTVGVPLAGAIRCSNDGADDPTSTRDNLFIEALVTGDDAWSASVRGGIPADGVPPGDSFELEVVFTPATAGSSHIWLTIEAGTALAGDLLFRAEAR